MASSLNDAISNSLWMEWITRLMGDVSGRAASRQTYSATLPPDRFYCLLDELPQHLIPQHFLRSMPLRECRGQTLYLNPNCILCTDGQVPDELISQNELISGFTLDGTIAWVRNQATGNLLPFWLGPQLARIVQSLRPNDPVPISVPERTQNLLAAANILIPEGSTSQPDRICVEMIEKASLLFRDKGYAPLSELIHPFHVAALRRYYRYLIRSGLIRLGDGQSPRRYVAYNEPVARFFHKAIAATLSAMAGEPLRPSYVYMASYLSGAELKKHTDRAQCEYSVTLCLDFSPEPSMETPWPIRLDTPTSTVTVYQALGDGLAYRGTRLPHYRSRLGEGQTSTSIFFHYVGADFSGSLD
jgi:hypothetical protein